MRVMPLALERQDGIDDVLEHLRSGEAAVLGDVADEDGGNVLALRGEQELCRRFAHLADAAGRRLELHREHGLHRVDDHERRPQPGDLLEDALDAGLRQQVERRNADAEPVAAALDLMLRLLARGVQHRPDGAREMCRGLQQERRLADARLAAEENEGAGHDAAAEHAIELADAARQPLRLCALDFRVQLGRAGGAELRVAIARRRRCRGLGHALLDQGIPGAALGAAPHPLGRLRPALLAHEHDFGGLHDDS
jgi:hypothetical protein